MSSDTPYDDDLSIATGIDFLTELLTSEEAQRQWLDELDPVKFALYTEAVMKIGGLRNESAWPEATVLDELRCQTRTRAELTELLPEHLNECNRFLGWIGALLATAPKDVRIRRQLISAASKLYEGSRRDVEACKTAMHAPVSATDSLTPAAIVHFGEIDTAFLVAQRALQTPAGDRARRLRDANGFGRMLVHIAPTTLDALLRYSNEEGSSELVFEHAQRLHSHVRGCKLCAHAYLERSSLIGLPPLEGLVDDSLLEVG